MLNSNFSVDDVSQEVFYRAFLRLSTFDFQGKFSTWLFGIANNHCIDILRRKKLIQFFSFSNDGNSFSENEMPDKVSSTAEILEARQMFKLCFS